jgi:hypothetical protein
LIRIALHNAAGQEISHCMADDGDTAVFNAMMLLSKLKTLSPGDTLTVAAADAPPITPDPAPAA